MMTYGSFFNRVGNFCLYQGTAASALQSPIVTLGAALLSAVPGANLQALGIKAGILDPEGSEQRNTVLGTSIGLTSAATGILFKAGFAAVPSLQIASFALGVSCKLLGWYLNTPAPAEAREPIEQKAAAKAPVQPKPAALMPAPLNLDKKLNAIKANVRALAQNSLLGKSKAATLPRAAKQKIAADQCHLPRRKKH